jgi:Protein of unknown function (DUF3237)
MTQEQSTLPVEFLFRFEADLGSRDTINDAPHGTRAIVNVTGGRFEGPRLKGTLGVPTGDWVTVRGDGSFKLDARVTLRTDDGALILMTYNGIGIFTEAGSSNRTAPLFETGDPRYVWLNRVQAVGVGERRGGSLVAYDVYALL